MTELKNYVELEHIATGYPVVIALNSKECQLLSHYYNIREDEVISYEDFKSYESEAYESLEKRMQLNGDLQEDEGTEGGCRGHSRRVARIRAPCCERRRYSSQTHTATAGRR